MKLRVLVSLLAVCCAAGLADASPGAADRAPLAARTAVTVPLTLHGDPWAATVHRWPDPPAESQLGADAVYYWFARSDRRSRLPAPTETRPLRIWAGGDSMSSGPIHGLRRLVGDDPRYRLTAKPVVSSGVVTDWFFDWADYMAGTVAEGPYDVIVVSMGGNDKQRFRGRPAAFGSTAWADRYRSRVRAMLASAARPGRLVIWVGLPPMLPRSIRNLPATVNPLTAAAAAEIDGAVYINAFEIMSVDGAYARRLGGDTGRRKIRAADGVHYTGYGGLLLAEAIMAEVEQRSG